MLQVTPLLVDGQMIAIVPARALSWHQVQLPSGTLARGFLSERAAPRLRAVLEGLLEDQLLDEPAQLHFALQPSARDNAPVWVCVCDRQWLLAQVQALQKAGNAPQRLVPEWTPVAHDGTQTDSARIEPHGEPQGEPPEPAPATRWVTGHADNAVLVWTDTLGVHTWPLHSPLPRLLPVAAELVAEPAVAELADTLLHRQPRVVTTAERLREAAQSEWNLAQFDLAAQSPWLARLSAGASALWRAPQWRPARWAVLTIALVQVVGLNAYAWRASTQLKAQRSAIGSALSATFPDIKVVVDAPLQMERAVAALQQNSGTASPRDLESLLAVYGDFSATASIEQAPTAIEYVANELRMSGVALDDQQWSDLSALAQTKGFASRREGDSLVLQSRPAP